VIARGRAVREFRKATFLALEALNVAFLNPGPLVALDADP
jgi:hypothetical protein